MSASPRPPMLGAMRSHAAGGLRAGDAGTSVRIGGWVARRRDHGGVLFVDLRDAAGTVQVVFHPDDAPAAAEQAHELRTEDCVLVSGVVRRRPDGTVNPELATGEVEVAAAGLEILAPSATPPFPVDAVGDGGASVDDTLRLRYRYLDLRGARAIEPLKLRAAVNAVTRRVMEEHGFLEIETPYLTRSTPEGARDFLVPTHLQPGSFYALPQSPQLFKQLLMVAGIERYYQIVRCFRDEALRADRQPEFTQLDVELSFLDEEDVYALIERLMAELFRVVLGRELELPLPRMRYDEAMRRFGSDKPDLRYGMELVDLGGVFAGTGVRAFGDVLGAGGSVIGLRVAASLSRARLDELAEWARGRGAKGLAWFVVEPETLRSPLDRFLSDGERAGLRRATGAEPGDVVLAVADRTAFARQLVGELRTRLAAALELIPSGAWAFTWVTHMPMFEWDEQTGRWDAVHHPFTAPSLECVDTFDKAPGDATARAYDLVLNGTELGGGSIRIHQADVQRRVFDVLGIGAEEAEEKFGFLLRGLSFGAPPHGGVAFGMDRIAMLLAGESSIREVIAFPKTQSGGDPLTGAPAPVPAEQLREVGLRGRGPA